MACAVYLREPIIFTLIFYIVTIKNCLPVILLKMNDYGVTATTMIAK